jgi:hypothetical protein
MGSIAGGDDSGPHVALSHCSPGSQPPPAVHGHPRLPTGQLTTAGSGASERAHAPNIHATIATANGLRMPDDSTRIRRVVTILSAHTPRMQWIASQIASR